MTAADRPVVAEIIHSVGNFNQAEVDCALELVDIYLQNEQQRDYRVIVAEREGCGVAGYACWGPTPMTNGTYDLYWIATKPDMQGKGAGRALMAGVEEKVRQHEGRMLVIETSSKASYEDTVRFYRRLGYMETARIADFYDRGDDRLIFVRRFYP